MHEPVVSRLEEALHSAEPLPEVEEHLKVCLACRQELTEMREQAELFNEFRVPDELEVSSAFYAKVMNRIESQVRPSVWNLFGESLFAKRLAYASLTLLVLLGTFLISAPEEQDTLISANTPEVALSGEDAEMAMDGDPQRDREAVLVNLTTYQEF